VRRFWTAIELTSSVLGFAWLFGPPSWQDANLRAVFTVLGIVVVLAGCFGVVALLPQRKSPYRWEEK
jgi:uncharacterized membrane protein HdeD (DUF308 family)